MSLSLPLRLVSEANARGHWSRGAKRARDQRETTRLAVRAALPRRRPSEYAIRITRLGVRRLDDDNLARAAKAVRDGVADALEIDDGDPRLSFSYDQEKSKQYGVRIWIEARS